MVQVEDADVVVGVLAVASQFAIIFQPEAPLTEGALVEWRMMDACVSAGGIACCLVSEDPDTASNQIVPLEHSTGRFGTYGKVLDLHDLYGRVTDRTVRSKFALAVGTEPALVVTKRFAHEVIVCTGLPVFTGRGFSGLPNHPFALAF